MASFDFLGKPAFSCIAEDYTEGKEMSTRKKKKNAQDETFLAVMAPFLLTSLLFSLL